MSVKFKIGLYIGVGILAVLAVLFITGAVSPFQQQSLRGELTVWDFKEHGTIFRDFFTQFQGQFPGVKITYVAKNSDTYEHDLLDALASGTGPDIFILKNDAIISHANKISPLIGSSPDAKAFIASAPDVVLQDLTDANGNVYGVPWSVDTLALYYNKDYFNAANIPDPPTTWDEFLQDSKELSRLSTLGAVLRSGASFGLSSNVDHAPDIFYALVLQSGNPILTLQDKIWHLTDSTIVNGEMRIPAASALKFYTDFANPDSPYYTWNSTKPESLDAFAAGDAAFYLGYARDLSSVLAKNAHLNFGVAPLPQLTPLVRTSYASYEFFTVSRASKYPNVAWKALAALSQPVTEKSIVDAMGLPPERRDLVNSKPPNKILQPWYDQVLSARSWPVPDADQVESIIRVMLESVVTGGVSPSNALSRAENQMKLLTSK